MFGWLGGKADYGDKNQHKLYGNKFGCKDGCKHYSPYAQSCKLGIRLPYGPVDKCGKFEA